MNYTPGQIERAKKNYNAMLQIRTVASYEPQYIGWATAEQRCDYHNSIVTAILGGDFALAKEWKLFFLNEEVKATRKQCESKAKLAANKEASASVLEPIRAIKKITAFGEWLNTKGNPFRGQFFSKKYTQESVAAYLQTL